MLTIEEHNSERAAHWSPAPPSGTDVHCPKCEEELVETNPGTQLMSMPPKINVHCPMCSWRGYLNA